MLGSLDACGPKQISDRDLVLVDPAEAVDLVAGGERLFGLAGSVRAAWVDPRGDRAFREGHIPGAIHVPMQLVTTDHAVLEGYDVLIVYGDDYGDAKAEGMSKRLLDLGFKDVRTLQGGLRAWTTAGYDLETGEGTGSSFGR